MRSSVASVSEAGDDESVVVEAEDYNYENGQFQDDPPPSGFASDGSMVNDNGKRYIDLPGTPRVGYAVTPTPSQDPQQSYRFLDDVNTLPSDDVQRIRHRTGRSTGERIRRVRGGRV
jgi:hypothetical protein